jgi:hypothetical protein
MPLAILDSSPVLTLSRVLLVLGQNSASHINKKSTDQLASSSAQRPLPSDHHSPVFFSAPGSVLLLSNLTTCSGTQLSQAPADGWPGTQPQLLLQKPQQAAPQKLDMGQGHEVKVPNTQPLAPPCRSPLRTHRACCVSCTSESTWSLCLTPCPAASLLSRPQMKSGLLGKPSLCCRRQRRDEDRSSFAACHPLVIGFF